ncbi:MAG: TetR/AcrR family transcriptional regulator [Chloroflexi bacterium]|nr:TetR/AcrR family transcriptional regulator [Chloroflexota bacterium]OJW02631.1 MAG: TetR family transcriptional regulator [Chloroflexi bacterium 54-19]
MARPKSEDKREAIMAAATKIFAAQGLSAPTAIIAKEAGVANGSLFNYFQTKADLLNQLYLELKTEMAAVSLTGLPTESDIKHQLFYMWSRWLEWATSYPDKRRTLTYLGVSDEITPASHHAGSQAMAGIARLLERSRENGPMQDAPLGFVVSLMTALAEATIDYMVQDPANAKNHCKVGFDAMWRIVA